jgi:outer membrane receptor protein involved in Fe transport
MNFTPDLNFQRQRVDFLYSDFNIGPNGLILREVTGADGAAAYTASLITHGAYVQGEGEILPAVRATLGVRYETGTQDVRAIDLFSATPLPGRSLKNDYLLPAGTLTWNFAEEQQLRAGASKTIARPQFREQAPQLYLDPEFDRTFIGNPFLQDSEIVNLDVRYERYFERGQFATAGLFYKDIKRPIESVVNESGSGLQQSFLNAPKAVVYGAEAEFKRYFEFETGNELMDSVRWLAAANYTFTKSEVKVGASDVVFPRTSLGQPAAARNFILDGTRLQGQSKHLANVQFGLETLDSMTQATVLLNYASNRTTARGQAGAPDFVQKPGVLVDFTLRHKFEVWGAAFTAGLEARNLLGEKYDEFQSRGGDRINLNVYDLGRSVSISLSARL